MIQMKIVAIIAVGLLALGGLAVYVNAEITRDTSAREGIDYKVFYYGINPVDMLSKTNADYEVTGYPSTQVLIKNWDKLTALEQATLTADLNAMGYFEVRG